MKYVVIGYSGPGDEAYVCAVHYLLTNGWDDVEQLLEQEAGFFDMASHPDRGDGIEAIDAETQMVIALHLHGMKGQDPVLRPSEMYNRNNGALLTICKRLKVPLLVVGEQPVNVGDLVALYVGDEIITSEDNEVDGTN